MEKGSSILVFSGPIHNNYWFTLFVITLPIVAFFVWLLENFSKTEGLNVKIKGTSLLRAKWMYVCVFFVCFHCLPVFFFLFLFLSNNYLSLHTLRFYTGMLFCLFTKLKNTEYKCFSSFHIFWYTMTVVEIVLIDYCNYVLSSYFKKAYYLKKKSILLSNFLRYFSFLAIIFYLRSFYE